MLSVMARARYDRHVPRDAGDVGAAPGKVHILAIQEFFLAAHRSLPSLVSVHLHRARPQRNPILAPTCLVGAAANPIPGGNTA